jgi:hypothetical protein
MYSYGNSTAALSGPDATRQMGTKSGALNRAARSLRRQGYTREAGQAAAAAEQAKIDDIPQEGPRWKSYETKQEEAAAATSRMAQNNMRMANLANQAPTTGGVTATPAATPIAPVAVASATPVSNQTPNSGTPLLPPAPPTATDRVAMQGKIDGKPFGQWDYEQRQRLRETQDVGKPSAAARDYADSRIEKDNKLRDERIQRKLRAQFAMDPAKYGTAPY